MFDEKEIYQIVFSGLLMAYIIAFPIFTLNNVLIALFFAALILIPHVMAHKIAAANYLAKAKYKVLEWRRFWFAEDSLFKKPFPIWLILPLIFIFITVGKFKLFIMETFELSWEPKKRIGRWYTELQENEIAIISLAGPMINLIFAFIGGIIFLATNVVLAKEFAILNAWFAFFTLLPIGTLDGTKVMAGGVIRWLFIFTFTIAILILLYYINVVIAFVIALLLAMLVGLWFLRMEYPKKRFVPLGVITGK